MQILGTLTKSTCTPLKRLILRAEIELSRSVAMTSRAICGAVLARSAADVKHESALGKGFPDPCRGRSLGRPAPFEPMKLPSEACILRQSALVSCQPPPAPRPLIPSSPLSQELVPLHRRGFGECTKARGGPNRHWELSWRLLGQRAGHHDGRASASAPTAAADGRKVLSDGRGAPSFI